MISENQFLEVTSVLLLIRNTRRIPWVRFAIHVVSNNVTVDVLSPFHMHCCGNVAAFRKIEVVVALLGQ
jgi:hypothetical protein